jgi:hypothetical protein
MINTTMRENEYWVRRTLCDVLYDIKEYTKKLPLLDNQKAIIISLTAEAQVMANRMEAALGEHKDLIELNDEWNKLRREVKDLRRERKEITSGNIELAKEIVAGAKE